MNLEKRERLCANYWDIATHAERSALLNGICMGNSGIDFYKLGLQQWNGLTLQCRALLLKLDWEFMLGRRLPGFEFEKTDD